MKEYKSIKEMLESTEQRLIEAQASIIERQKEIEIDLEDCRKALAALDHVPQDKEKRVPKDGDILLALETDEYTTLDKEYIVNTRNVKEFYITDDEGSIHEFTYENWRKYFRFKDEKPADEDKANLHSYLHVNQEPKKPYRIKAWDEMVNTEGFEINQDGDIDVLGRSGAYPFTKDMKHLCGHPLEYKGKQYIDAFTIEPWMITENT